MNSSLVTYNIPFQLRRAGLFNSNNTTKPNYSNQRISKTGWLEQKEHSDVEKLYQRIGDITGLSMISAESLQVNNYGIGGHYEPHYDYDIGEFKG